MYNIIPILQKYLAPYPIEIAYLYGSYARGANAQNSDIDIGVLLNSFVSKKQSSEILQRIENNLTGALQAPVQIENIAMSPPLLKHSIVLEGKLIMEKNKDARIALEVRTLHEYEDNRCIFDIPYNTLKRKMNYERKT
jgi:predicted nucleotidyltransferase